MSIKCYLKVTSRLRWRRTQRFISRIQDDGGISIFCCCFYTPECAICVCVCVGQAGVARWVNREIWSTKIKKSASVRSLKWKFCDGIESKVKKFPADASFVALQHYDHHPPPSPYIHTPPHGTHTSICVCVCVHYVYVWWNNFYDYFFLPLSSFVVRGFYAAAAPPSPSPPPSLCPPFFYCHCC